MVDFLKSHRLWLEKRSGQHFLIDAGILDKIVQAADIQPNTTVLEIGPGVGVLTERLARTPAHLVLAVERDQKLVDVLRARLKNQSNVKITHQDILRFRFDQLEGSWQVVANIPYQITGAIVREVTNFDLANPPRSLTLLVQQEVADRLLAQPGDNQRGIPTILVELYGHAQRIADVPANKFFPAPAVHSTVIRIERHITPPANPEEAEPALRLAKIGFAGKRRTIENSLAAGLRVSKGAVRAFLAQANVDPTLRAEDLSVTDWLRAAAAVRLSFH